eukprot:2356940-Alexandrium_andersonii.AAC.1
MSASLVGSEMCIRDRVSPSFRLPPRSRSGQLEHSLVVVSSMPPTMTGRALASILPMRPWSSLATPCPTS